MKTEKIKIEFMGYTIEEVEDRNPYSKYGSTEFMYYPTHEGVNEDYDCDDGETFSYCGNCRWASDLQDAKDYIHDLNPLTNDWKTEEDWAKEEQQMNDNDAAEDKIVNL